MFKKSNDKSNVQRVKTNKKAVIRTSIMEISSNDLNEAEALAASDSQLEFDKEEGVVEEDVSEISEFAVSSTYTAEKLLSPYS